MALGAVLKDRGRIRAASRTAERVEGKVVYTDVPGSEFRCRLEMPMEREDADQGRQRRTVRPKIIVGRKIRLDGTDDIEVWDQQVPEMSMRTSPRIRWSTTSLRLDMARPTDEQIKLVRDAFLETYVRRNPQAQPEPGTSLYAVLEATGAVLSALFAAVPDAEQALIEFLENDRQEVIQPDPDPLVYTRLEEVVERDEESGKAKRTKPNRSAEAQEWPCVRNSEGSF